MSGKINSSINQVVGLTTSEAQLRLLKFGPNEIIPTKLESSLSELKRIFTDPMGLMLLGLSGLYAILGDTTDSIVLLVAFIPVSAVDVILELKSRKALRALKSTLKLTAKVIRDEKIQEVIIQNIVIGDVLVFEEGQSLPADGKIIECEQLAINESALTGESIPVEKSLGHSFFGGTVVLQGRGLGLVEATGIKTKFGKIALLLQDTESESSPLLKKVNKLVRLVIFIAFGLAVLLFCLEIFRDKQILPSLIVALTFGMAAIPEEFPLVFTLYLSMGAWRLSKHGVLIKSLPSVEALGSVDVICTDKTGTLTEGKFQLEDLYPFDPVATKEVLWQTALMACEEKPVDAMEIAITQKGNAFANLLSDWKLQWDYPFEPNGKYMSHVWINSTNQTLIAMKGAVEGVIGHCQLNQIQRSKLLLMADQFASQGKRLLGLAVRQGPCRGDRQDDERNLQFLGILVFSDPVRSSVPAAIAACQNAGIKIKMLTGDHPLTAHAVADDTGIIHSHEYLFTGAQLAEMSKEQRWQAYQDGAVFSRVLPEQKHEMVQALKEAGNIVAMTGDGINDAPALKLADIGISMGQNATDVARSTAKMVLLKNDFNGIVEAVFEGRRIFSNLKRSFSYLVSFHIPVILLALTPPLLGWGDLLLPIHIILLELLVHPVSAFAFENLPNKENMAEKELLSKKRFFEALLAGFLLSFVSLALFRFYLKDLGIDSARAVAFSSIFFGNAVFVIIESWPFRTRRLYIVIVSLIVATLVFGLVSSVKQFLHFDHVDLTTMLLAFFLSLLASVPTFILRNNRSK